MNRGDSFDVFYFDFSAAFESTTHAKLLECLPKYGVGPRISSWIKCFLTDRTFAVKVNDSMSSTARVTTGCPQGTILGCLCYILYTNSLRYVLPKSVSVKVYADDIKLYTRVNIRQDCENLQRILDDFHVDMGSRTSEYGNFLHFGSEVYS